MPGKWPLTTLLLGVLQSWRSSLGTLRACCTSQPHRGSGTIKCLPSLCHALPLICPARRLLYEKVQEARAFLTLCVADSKDQATGAKSLRMQLG